MCKMFAAQVEPESALLAGTQGASAGRLQVFPGIPRHLPVFKAQHPQLRIDLRQKLLLSWRPRKHRGCTIWDSLQSVLNRFFK